MCLLQSEFGSEDCEPFIPFIIPINAYRRDSWSNIILISYRPEYWMSITIFCQRKCHSHCTFIYSSRHSSLTILTTIFRMRLGHTNLLAVIRNIYVPMVYAAYTFWYTSSTRYFFIRKSDISFISYRIVSIYARKFHSEHIVHQNFLTNLLLFCINSRIHQFVYHSHTMVHNGYEFITDHCLSFQSILIFAFVFHERNMN